MWTQRHHGLLTLRCGSDAAQLYTLTKSCSCHLMKTNFVYILLRMLSDISDIPDDIKHLGALQVADFSSNPIPRLPIGFSQLKSLTILGLNDMSLTSLPDDFGR